MVGILKLELDDVLDMCDDLPRIDDIEDDDIDDIEFLTGGFFW